VRVSRDHIDGPVVPRETRGATRHARPEDSMRKLKMEIEELKVESFDPLGDDERELGTVHARQYTEGWGTCDGTCRQWTCDGSCDQTCGPPASCDPLNSYCGTYPEHGCANSWYYCTDQVWVC
jgi:hypothetical protein